VFDASRALASQKAIINHCCSPSSNDEILPPVVVNFQGQIEAECAFCIGQHFCNQQIGISNCKIKNLM
jgi:hypothetical protein